MKQSLILLSFICLSLIACQSEKKSEAKTALHCSEAPSIPKDSLLGEFDPIASDQAVACGEINLWGASFPKSLNMWEDYNSFSVQVMGFLFEPLVGLHSTEDRPIGSLADQWETSADGKTYTFHLNPLAKWSDGQPVTAEDVQFYYDVIMNPKHLTPLFKVGLKRFSRPVVIDSLTLQITAQESHWGNFWEAAGLVAFPKHVWNGKNFDDIRFDFPVVSGPYRVGELAKNRYLVLERRQDWWGRRLAWNHGKYNFDKIRYRFMEDRTKALEALKKGDFDTYTIYTSSIWMKQTDFDAVQKNWVVRQKVKNKEPIGFQGLAINMRRAKFKDVRVRQALALLLNRKLLNEKYMYNQYFLLNSYYPDLFENNINPENPLLMYQPDSARQLLKAAGYQPNDQGKLEKDGQILSIVFLSQSADIRHLTKYAEDLKAVGIETSIEQMAWATLRKRLDEFDYDMYWINWSAGRLRDPEASWHSKVAQENGSNNLAGVSDPVVDSLIELQKTEMDLAKRNDILRSLDKRLMKIMPYVLLWQSDSHRLLYWNRFGTPSSVLDKYNREEAALIYWWYDQAKDEALQKARQENKALPALPAEVQWKEIP